MAIAAPLGNRPQKGTGFLTLKRFVCIHGHFYQPPRENPWLEAIELQDSAYPYHDWNDRITAECYRPNSTARILDGQARIASILNNYSRISFNFGPTLLGWMEKYAGDVYQAVLEADRTSRERFSGHGSAMAQVFNHIIMPLANRRDKVTQIRWGVEDFRQRYGRDPEGMWLSEAAVDLETLDLLADAGIRFTVLSPHQADSVREIGDREWREVAGARINPKVPYRQKLPSGREIALFFYDGPVSQAIAFEGLLSRGEDLAKRLLGLLSKSPGVPELAHVATDGETFGHHHRHGEMSLAYALQTIEDQDGVELTNYAEFLDNFEELPEVRIIENSSWSCVHGIERWRSDCGCNSGRQGWNQAWRGPLRAALDWLRDELAPVYEEEAARTLSDPWQARDDYIGLVYSGSRENVDEFFSTHQKQELESPERVRTLKWLELQRHAMLMYTSCGWFFDELSGIETVQVIQYAGRAVQLAHELTESSGIEGTFLEKLELAKSNLPEHRDGRKVYEKWVRPSRVGLPKVAAHFAASSLFEDYEKQTEIYAFTVNLESYHVRESGRFRLVTGWGTFSSKITLESAALSFACVHLGDHNLFGGVRAFQGQGGYLKMDNDLEQAFSRADVAATLRKLDSNFVQQRYSLNTLFRDEQRKILDLILDATLEEAEASYRHLIDRHGPLMNFLAELGTPIPEAFQTAAKVVLSADLRDAMGEEELNLASIRSWLQTADRWHIELDREGLSYAVKQRLWDKVNLVHESPRDEECLARLQNVVEVALMLPFEVDLSLAQNVVFAMIRPGSSRR